MNSMILKNEDDIYIYFEAIRQLEAQAVLDIGMFLKRVGSISRKIMNMEAPETVQLDGVDFFREIHFPVWSNIYQKITDAEDFFLGKTETGYDLAIAFGLESIKDQASVRQILESLKGTVRYLLLDDGLSTYRPIFSDARILDFSIDQSMYYLLDLGKIRQCLARPEIEKPSKQLPGHSMDTRIYVMTHKKIERIPNELYIPMQVGKCGKEGFGYPGDDKGDHISLKNDSYCELTGIYWLWKNVKCDAVGICHYRRFFMREEQLLDQESIENQLVKYPIIVPNSRSTKDTDVYGHYSKQHKSSDLDLCRQVIKERHPDYLAAFDFSMQTILISIGNMWITRKDIFDRYCEWLFDILFAVEEWIPIDEYDAYQKRVIGFLAERLFRVWLFMQPEPITEENAKLMEIQDIGKAEKKESLIYQYVKLKIMPLLQLYQADFASYTEAELPPGQIGSDGKMPVWVCWWQKEAAMPELIRCCYDSIKRNLPEDSVEIHLITLENCKEYVTFTDSIIQKFNEGKISGGLLSEILQAELLYRYGGLWIDAAYYIPSPVSKTAFCREPLYTLRDQAMAGAEGFAKKKWPLGFWYSQKGNLLFRFLMDCLWYYWEMEEAFHFDSLAGYIIAIAAEELEEIKRELQNIPVYEGQIFKLQEMISNIYTPERMQKLNRCSAFYQLDCKKPYQRENIAQEQTIYGYLVSQKKSNKRER